MRRRCQFFGLFLLSAWLTASPIGKHSSSLFVWATEDENQESPAKDSEPANDEAVSEETPTAEGATEETVKEEELGETRFYEISNEGKAPKLPLGMEYATAEDLGLDDEDDEEEDAVPKSSFDAEDKDIEITTEAMATLKEKAEPHRFQAEVERIMGIIINSLYTQKDVFLRELISNAADALEKIRFLSVTDSTGLGDVPDLEIRITFDKAANTLTISDTGVGMTKHDLINNLGTVAKSGTSNFLEALAQGGDVNLVGQFGVGFYSAFLVADRVVVTTKHNDDKQYIWESSADAQFTVVEDPRGNTLGRGTRITLHLKPDATDFATESKLKETVTRYSQFIPHPIYLQVEKKKTVEETVEDPEAAEGDEPKKISKRITYKSWNLQNPQKAIWLRSVKDVTQTEYKDFYRSISKDGTDPLAHIHFMAEGEVEFKAIIYIPAEAARDAWQQYFGHQNTLKLYVRRVLVSDSFEDLMPKYLHWVKGVVDSDDLPLKVDREQLSQNKIMKSISKKLVRKALELIKKLSKEDEKTAAAATEGSEEEKKPSKYEIFLKEFGRNLKLGCFEDEANRSKIVKVLRYYTLNSPTKQISLDQYIEGMKEDQKEIFYMSGESVEHTLSSPLIKGMKAEGKDVVLLVDPTDESCLARLTDFEGKKFVSIQKGDLSLDDSEDGKKKMKKLTKHFHPLTEFFKNELGQKIGKVVVTGRSIEDPCVVVASQHGYSAYMEKVLKTQTFANIEHIKMMAGMKTLEINPMHPINHELLARVQADPSDESLKKLVKAMHASAMIASGFELPDTSPLTEYVYGSLVGDLGVSNELKEPMIPETADTDTEADDVEVGDDDVVVPDEPEDEEVTEIDDEVTEESKGTEDVKDEL